MGDVVSHVDLFAAPVILEIASLAAGVRGQSRRDQSYRTSELQSLSRQKAEGSKKNIANFEWRIAK